MLHHCVRFAESLNEISSDFTGRILLLSIFSCLTGLFLPRLVYQPKVSLIQVEIIVVHQCNSRHKIWQNFQLIYKPELSPAADKNGSDIARMLIVDIGLKEKWGEFSAGLDKTIFTGGGLSLSIILTMLKMKVDSCEGKSFEWLFCADI
jgi:hypothetical protein